MCGAYGQGETGLGIRRYVKPSGNSLWAGSEPVCLGQLSPEDLAGPQEALIVRCEAIAAKVVAQMKPGVYYRLLDSIRRFPEANSEKSGFSSPRYLIGTPMV